MTRDNLNFFFVFSLVLTIIDVPKEHYPVEDERREDHQFIQGPLKLTTCHFHSFANKNCMLTHVR